MITVVCEKYGPPDVLEFKDAEKPAPKDNEILIKIHASTVAVADIRVRAFDVPLSFWLPARLILGIFRPKYPVMGVEMAGEVVEVGEQVTRFKVGDQVYGSSLDTFGAYAEYKCVPEDSVIAKKPANLSYEEAAAVPIGARTAMHFLTKANIQPGQKILVYGASGSVGTYVIQLAKHYGAEVTAVCSSRNVELVKSLGADHVIDYTKEHFAEAGVKYDIFFGAVNKYDFSDAIKAVKEGGVYVNITDPVPSLAMLFTKWTSSKTIIVGDNPRPPELLIDIRKLIEAGKLKPVMDRVYPLEDIVEAHRYVAGGHKRGNVAITINHPSSIVV